MKYEHWQNFGIPCGQFHIKSCDITEIILENADGKIITISISDFLEFWKAV